MSTVPHKRRWYQFRLRTLFLFMTVSSVGLGWLGSKLQEARQQRVAVEMIQRLGGARYDYEGSNEEPIPNAQPPGPEWLRKLLGDDCFVNVTRVHLSPYADHCSNDDLAPLSNLSRLEYFWATSDRVTDDGLKHLANLTQLRNLWLDFSLLTDAGTPHLRRLTNLKVLHFHDSLITDAGLENFEGMTELEELKLGHAQVTDAGVPIIARMKKLHTLDLRTKLTDAGLLQLEGLSEL